MAVVSDTTPLNNLIQIDFVEMLHALFGDVVLPRGVVAELSHGSSPEKVRRWSQGRPPWLTVEDVVVPGDEALARLEAGEKEAIVLAEQRGLPLLIDERAGRAVARSRGVVVTGTLGALDEAAERGLLDFAEAIGRLQQTTFHVSSKVLKPLLERDRERKKKRH
jgi:predicted nucleic acid-binding protein